MTIGKKIAIAAVAVAGVYAVKTAREALALRSATSLAGLPSGEATVDAELVEDTAVPARLEQHAEPEQHA
ncbi:MAG TPA: hypothetical protein VK427_24965, partial [Kofleriaceae bacterium]|nr:hypothetical protein [Kofleriaceae bacterium]